MVVIIVVVVPPPPPPPSSIKTKMHTCVTLPRTIPPSFRNKLSNNTRSTPGVSGDKDDDLVNWGVKDPSDGASPMARSMALMGSLSSLATSSTKSSTSTFTKSKPCRKDRRSRDPAYGGEEHTNYKQRRGNQHRAQRLQHTHTAAQHHVRAKRKKQLRVRAVPTRRFKSSGLYPAPVLNGSFSSPVNTSWISP